MSLQKRIEEEAFAFAHAIIAALRSASIDELTSLGAAKAVRHANGALPKAVRTRGGRLARRSSNDIARALEQIVAVLTAHPEGLRAEEIRTELGLDSKEMPRPLKEGLDSGRLKKSGQKRATVYTLGAGGLAVGGETRAAKKRAASKRRASKKA
jgi:hypothetical protein